MSILNRSLAALLLFGLPALADSSVQGINNFFQVDEHVYRGAQPTTEGFEYLAKIGIKTVLDLREDAARSSGEAQLVTSLGMQYVNVPMTGLTPPTEAEITKVLTLLEDATAGAVFVHCLRGADRTGAVIAAYRIDHDRWDNARALKEAVSLGMSPFQLPRQNFIRKFRPLTIKSDPKSPIALRIEGNSNRLAEPPLGKVLVSAPGAFPTHRRARNPRCRPKSALEARTCLGSWGCLTTSGRVSGRGASLARADGNGKPVIRRVATRSLTA
jgi:tyrosine-protein phosphatase SIW14